ncbi:MAG: phosphomannomutase/phosphoglucomutase [Gammaproteobacteria bacterium]
MGRRSSRRRKKRSSGGSSSGGQGLTFVSILAFVLFSLILAVGLFVNQADMSRRLQQQQQVVAEANAQQSATSLSKQVTSYQYLMAGIVTDPSIERLIRSGDKEAISERQQQLTGLFPDALQVRLLAAGIKLVDRSVTPHLSFACLDMLRNSERLRKAPAAEVHVYGTDQQHIDIVQPIISTQDKQVIGHMQVVLDVKLIKHWVKQAVNDNYIELIQKAGKKKPLVLGRAGSSENKVATPIKIDIEGTRWSINAWVPARISVSIFNVTFLTILGVGVVLAAFVVFILRRSVSRAITADLDNFIQLAVQVIRGNKAHEYTVKMPEFKSAVVRLHNMPMTNTMERERDHDPSSIGVSHEGLEPSLPDKSSISMEELDSDLDDLDDIGDDEPSGDYPGKKPEAPIAQGGTTISQVSHAGNIPPAEIFKAYDIRGIVGKSLTVDSIEVIGRAIGSEAASRGLKVVAFGRDGRLSGPDLGKALIKGIISTGIDVIDVGMVPTPALYYAAAEKAAGSGLMLTGSHNPPDYNGIKMVLGGETLSGETIQKLRERIENNDFTTGNGNYSSMEIKEQYVQRITSDIKLNRKLKIVVDCGNGVAGIIAPTLFKQLGCEVIEMFCNVDGNFPHHHPDPSQPENLRDLINGVKESSADLGLAFDGDGDRIGVISGDGTIIWPDRLMMLYAEDILKRNPGSQIIFDIKCSSNLMKFIWEKGGEPLMWKTGHSLIKAKMKQTGALLAGEMSGHIFFKERWYGFDDALYAAARLLEILSKDMRKPRVVLSHLADAVNTPELKIHMPEGEHHKFMERLLAEADFGDANVSMIDGIRADYADGWGLVRASNTTPCLVLRFEGQDEEAIKKVQTRFRKVLLLH